MADIELKPLGADDREQFIKDDQEAFKYGATEEFREALFMSCCDWANIERILNTEGMVRSPRKISAVINNARCYCKVRNETAWRNTSSFLIWTRQS